MFASFLAYLGLIVAAAGVYLMVRPNERLRVTTRSRASLVLVGGLLITAGVLAYPTSESSPRTFRTRLDEFVPKWQFREYHTIKIAAPPERVYDAIKKVRANEIFLFETLTWIRRAGRSTPQGILNPGNREPVLDAEVAGGFALLADDASRELLIGTAVITPDGIEGATTPDMFRHKLVPGVALAAMNFLITPDGASSTVLSTETRVYANNPTAGRQFAAYWRMIYPGSAFLRRSWLRAVAKRATKPDIP